MKAVFVLFLLGVVVSSTYAQFGFGWNAAAPRPWGGFPSSDFYQQVILQAETQKLLSQPNLPEDLRQRTLDVLSNAEIGFDGCNTAPATLHWIQIRCITSQLQKSKAELKVIDDEAKARALVAANSLTV